MTGEHVFELIAPDPAETGARSQRPARSHRRGTSSSTSRPIRGPTTIGLEYLLGVVDEVDTGAAVPRRSGRPSRTGEGGVRALHPARHRAARRPSRDARLPLRRLRVGRYQAPDAAPRDRADEVDRLLRGDVLVDLLNVVRQGVRASVESYSLKQIEKFYMPTREGPVTDAGFSVVAFETLAQGRRRRRSSTGSRRTTATTASRRGAPRLARGAARRGRWLAGRSSTGAPGRRAPGAIRGAHDWLQAVEAAGRGPDGGPRPRRPTRPDADGRGVCSPASSTGTGARRSRSGGASSS